MWVGLSLAVAFLQVGGLHAEVSAANWSAGMAPTAWPVPTTMETTAEWTTVDWPKGMIEPLLACKGDGDCPPWSRCEETAGSGRRFCRCGLGSHLHPSLGCIPARVFAARLLLLPPPPPPPPLEAPTEEQVDLQLRSLFHRILGHLDGYLGTSVPRGFGEEVMLTHHFSARVPATVQEVEGALAAFRARCHDKSSPVSHGQLCAFLHQMVNYQSLSLCDLDPCDPFSTTCSAQEGLLRCTCRAGFLQADPMDRTCAACYSGLFLQDGTCARCPFGFSGPGCQEPFLLALVLVSCFAGILLLLLLLFLVVLLLPGAPRPPPEPPGPPPLALLSPPLNLPRVRPPWTQAEEEGPHGDSRRPPPVVLWEAGGAPGSGPRSMKTFLGGPKTPPPAAAPQPLAGNANLAFVGDAAEGVGRRSAF
ncbi:protein HEG homolog 1 isoform X2 [Anolis carolinensis]|uniref:protein HEG homolog 1 isoform X2 n=1 Tax=Anolis carolinensis TaxID=28377 RepID=UPI002F2B44A3